MKIIVGLGNPGDKYENTRHNIGFMIVDKFAYDQNITLNLDSDIESVLGQSEAYNENIKLIKPQTFMNESGRAVQKILHYYKIEDSDTWVIHDDVDLDFGKIKVQFGGSSAGHHGVQSVIDNIGEEFWRIRIGVGKNPNIPTDEWVLRDFDDHEKLKIIIDKANDFMLEFLKEEIKETIINI